MTTVADAIHIALAEVGYHEGRSGGHWNNREKYARAIKLDNGTRPLEWVVASREAWCAVFNCWVLWKVGALDLLPGGPTASVAHMMDAAKQVNQWSEYPAIGALIVYGNGEHTGFVVDYDDTTVTTVEGNTNLNGSPEGDGVYKKVHHRTDPWVTGYVYIKYPEGIESADPKWQHAKPKRKHRMHTHSEAKKANRPTRVTHARKPMHTALHILNASVHNGRTGAVRIARNDLRKAIHHLPER